MPADSSWNMPVVSPEPRRSKVFWSSSGMSSRRILTPRSCSMSRSACSRIVRFPSPRKSNFSTPSFSSCLSSYCVWSALTLPFERSSGTSCVIGSREITTPAACVPVDRTRPSTFSARSRSRCTCPSCSRSRSSADIRRESVRVVPNGMVFPTRSASPYGGEDPLLVREADEVLHDEDVTRVAGLRDDRELLVDPLAQLRRDGAVLRDRARFREHAELLLGRPSRRDLEVREAELTERQA